MARRKLGEILMKAGVVDAKDVTAALREQLRWGGPLGRIMIDMKLLTEDVLVKALSEQLEVRSVDLDQWAIPPQIIELIPGEIAERHTLIAFNVVDRSVEVAMSDPTQQGVIDEIQIRTHMDVHPYIAGPKALERAIAKYYARGAGTLDLTLGKAGAALLDGPEDRDDLADTSGLIVPDEKTQSDTAQFRKLRDSQVQATVVPGPQPLPGSTPPPIPGAAPSSTRSGTFRTGLSAADAGSSQPQIAAPVEAPGFEDLKMMLRLVREELRATQRRVATLESLLSRDEDVLRKLLSLLIEKRVATREEILARIK